jgi:cell division protein FtsX
LIEKKVIANYFYIITTSLVFFLFGSTLLIWLQSLDIGLKIQEQSPIVLELKSNYSKDSLQLMLDEMMSTANLHSSDIQFIAKEKAIEHMKAEMPNEQILTSEESLFRDLILVKMANKIKYLPSIKSIIQKYALIEGLDVENEFATKSMEVSNRLSKIMMFLTMAILIIAVVITSFLVKIYLQERQDVIIAMQNLGSPIEKITEPYLKQSIIYSIVSTLMAIGFLCIIILMLRFVAPWMYELIELRKFFLVVFVLLIIGPTLHYILVKSQILKMLKY